MRDYDDSYFLRNYTFIKQQNLLIYWYYFITNNDYWKYIKTLNFLQEDQSTIFENIEKKGDIQFIKPGKTFKKLLNEAKKHNLTDTDLLHILLFMKLVCDKSYSVEDFPLLIESDNIVINPLFT
tara:strand:+ start:2821 stop:3192 length:372 start_codon:yes stop_codon:yes gene_type:complete